MYPNKTKKSIKKEVYDDPHIFAVCIAHRVELLVLTHKTIPFNKTITHKTFYLWDKPQPRVQVNWGSRTKSPSSWEKTTTII